MAVRFLHTADWQLGIKYAYVAPERAAQLRMSRFNAVRKIAQLARERKVDAVLVAGDVMDDNGVGRDTLQQTDDALAQFDVPVLLLPGNHDPATPDSALARLAKPKHVHLAVTKAPIHLERMTVYPCPLMTRHQYDDPGAWIPERAAGDGVRVALAHGGALKFGGGDCEVPNRIDVDRMIGKGIDYVALGDWHGTFKVNDRAYYSGAHEATRFKEKGPGNVLIVEIDEPGVLPRVEVVRIANTRWLQHDVAFSEAGQVAELRTFLDALPERAQTLVELNMTGHLPIKAKAELDALLEDYGERLAHLDLGGSQVLVQPTEEELAAFTAEGFIGQAADDLRTSTEASSRDALVLLHRLMQGVA
jgi:DNA repair exonuclease SbcCD nuclease subunit